MKFSIMTLFPAMIDSILNESIIGRARKNKIIDVNCYDIRTAESMTILSAAVAEW